MKPFPTVPKRDRPREISIQGIPDPWLEYLVLEDINKPSGSSGQCRVRCNSFDVSQSLWRDYGISLEQGIPNYKITVMESRVKRNEASERATDEQNPRKNLQKESSCQPDEPIIETEEKRPSDDKKPKKKSLIKENFTKNLKENPLITDENINWIENSLPNEKINKKYFKRENPRKQSKIVKVMKGIFRRWRKNSKRMSNDLSKFDDNFVCYHCNCPYFKVCKSCRCSGVEKSLKKSSKPRKSEDFKKPESRKKLEENFESEKNAKNSRKFSENSRIQRNERFDEDISTSRASPIIESNEIHSSSSNSALSRLRAEKRNDKENEAIGFNSRISLKSKSSSERMKKLVNDCFPRELETCDEKIREKRLLRSVETSENENSSLQTEFAEIQKFESNFMGRGDEKIFSEGVEERREGGELKGVMENDWLFAARNFGRLGAFQDSAEREFDFEELQKDLRMKNSESVKILYEGLSRKKTLNNLQIDNFLVEGISENFTKRN